MRQRGIRVQLDRLLVFDLRAGEGPVIVAVFRNGNDRPNEADRRRRIDDAPVAMVAEENSRARVSISQRQVVVEG